MALESNDRRTGEGSGLGPNTRYAHVGLGRPGASISTPIYRSAVFRHGAYGERDEHTYSRLGNPTRARLEEEMAQLTDGVRGLAFSSGMAALHCAFSLLAPGDRVIASSDLYGHTYRLLTDHVARRGVTVDFVDTFDSPALERAVRSPVSMVFVETPSNPLMRITSVQRAAAVAHGAGALLAVDNTFMTPFGQRCMALGADLEIHSATKALAGHNDVLAGLLVVRDPQVGERLARHQMFHGAVLSPDDAWLVLRGMKTLPLRLERQSENAFRLATWLSSHPKVAEVYYPALKGHPGRATHESQASMPGGLLSFELKRIRDVPELFSRLEVITFAESLGGVESLITHPAGQTHRDIPAEERRKRGISDRLVRLSVGIEDLADLKRDLVRALADEP